MNLPRLLFFLTIVFCSIAELILLEVKYQFFAGGFLQSHQLLTTGQRISFVLIFLLLNFILYGAAYYLWRGILRKFSVSDTIIAFHYLMVAGIITCLSLVVQFQLHKYFADAMDAALIQNIAGGDLKTGLMYALDEAFLFFLGLLGLLAGYYLIFKLLKSTLTKYEASVRERNGGGSWLSRLGYFVCTLLLAVIAVLLINTNASLAYNLNKTNSYSLISTALDFASDLDFDGYGSFRIPQDSKPLDSTVYPGALDVPGNGVDEDGFFGDFVDYRPAMDFKPGQARAGGPRHILVIMLESARAEVIDKYLDDQLVAPNLNALSQEGIVVSEAYSHTGYTESSLTSVFSGRIGAFKQDLSVFPILKKQGYRIAIFSGQDESWGDIDKKLSTRENTDYFYDAQTGVDERVFPSKLPSSIKLSEETLWRQFKKYSDKLNWEKPQFIYFNMQAGHFPYFHNKMRTEFIQTGIPRSEISADNREWLQRTYWNAMNHADFYIGKIIAELKDKGVWGDTLLIVSGDHGEELFDDNHLGHGFFPSEVQTRIPLIISQRSVDVRSPIGLSDLKEIMLSFAFSSDGTLSEEMDSQQKLVFQMIGSLDRPNKIALRFSGKKQIVLDLRNMLVRATDTDNWISYETALNDIETAAELKKLILYWENLRWQSFLESSVAE